MQRGRGDRRVDGPVRHGDVLQAIHDHRGAGHDLAEERSQVAARLERDHLRARGDEFAGCQTSACADLEDADIRTDHVLVSQDLEDRTWVRRPCTGVVAGHLFEVRPRHLLTVRVRQQE